jgi:hypothetical protein
MGAASTAFDGQGRCGGFNAMPSCRRSGDSTVQRDAGAVQVLVDTERPLVRRGDYRKPHVITKRQAASGD